MFRQLNPTEEQEFRTYARENPPNLGKWELYHPICRDEWIKRGIHPRERKPSRLPNREG